VEGCLTVGPSSKRLLPVPSAGRRSAVSSQQTIHNRTESAKATQSSDVRHHAVAGFCDDQAHFVGSVMRRA